MDYAFEYFINLKNNSIAEITSQAIDSKLKKNSANQDES
jgi:hypothetical protein